jgi:fructokinase
MGIASFGPLDLDRTSPTYGALTTTPKLGWSGVNLRREIEVALQVPTRVNTDVVAAAITELTWGAARHAELVVYITVGTGIGGGAIHRGVAVKGLLHAEMGHMRVPRADRDTFEGVCTFHRDCIEGLASAPAIEARWGRPASDLEDDHPAWDLEAHYLGTAIANLALVMTPDRIVLGGGVLHRTGLIERVRAVVIRSLARYLAHPQYTDDISDLLVAPALGDRAGVWGALCLARDELDAIDGASRT